MGAFAALSMAAALVVAMPGHSHGAVTHRRSLARSADVRAVLDISGPGGTHLVESLSGSFSWIQRRGNFVQRLSVLGAVTTVDEVVDHRYVYTQLTAPSGTSPWLQEIWSGYAEPQTPLSQLLSYAAAYGGAGGITNPAVLLREVKQDASATASLGRTRLGRQVTTEEAFTVPFTRVDSASTDLRQYELATGGTSLVFYAWLDRAGRLAQIRLAIDTRRGASSGSTSVAPALLSDGGARGVSAHGVRITVTVAFSHYRIAVTASIPPSAELSHVVHCRFGSDGPTCAGQAVAGS